MPNSVQIILKILCLVAFMLPAVADETNEANEKLGGDEIKQILTGNSLVGNWGDKPYCQYFSENGYTTFQFDDDRVSNGQWSVRDNRYCSIWLPSNRESCYNVIQREDKIIWHPGPDNAAIVIEGEYGECPPKENE